MLPVIIKLYPRQPQSDFVKREWGGDFWKGTVLLHSFRRVVVRVPLMGYVNWGLEEAEVRISWKVPQPFSEILTATNPPSDCRRLARNRPHDFHRSKSLRQRVQGWSESMVVHEETSLSETWFFRFPSLTISTGFKLLISHWDQEQLFGRDDRTYVVNHFKRKKSWSLLRLIS